MALEDAVFKRLTTHVGTSELIERRVYPLVKPQGEKQSCVVYQQMTGGRTEAGGSDTGLTNPLFQFRCIAPSYSEANALAVQVVSALSRWSGTVEGQTIQGTFDSNKRDGDMQPADNGKIGLYSVLVDARIWHLES